MNIWGEGMIKKIIYTFLITAPLCISFEGASTEIHSSSYEIISAAIPGGGAFMTSNSYNMIITAAQPSPIMENDNLPESVSYVLYPGFWNTLDRASNKTKAMPWIILLLSDE